MAIVPIEKQCSVYLITYLHTLLIIQNKPKPKNINNFYGYRKPSTILNYLTLLYIHIFSKDTKTACSIHYRKNPRLC